jgi:hypothetical protein
MPREQPDFILFINLVDEINRVEPHAAGQMEVTPRNRKWQQNSRSWRKREIEVTQQGNPCDVSEEYIISIFWDEN